jgi:hypothetical protein
MYKQVPSVLQFQICQCFEIWLVFLITISKPVIQNMANKINFILYLGNLVFNNTILDEVQHSLLEFIGSWKD